MNIIDMNHSSPWKNTMSSLSSSSSSLSSPSSSSSSDNNKEDIFEAIESYDIARIEEILQRDATTDIHTVDSSWKKRGSPLVLACKIGDLFLTKLFVEKYGADVNQTCYNSNDNNNGYFVTAVKSGSNSPLLYAVAHKDIKLIEYLLSHGANVNQRSCICGDTPLSIACSCNCIDIIELLLFQYNADANLGDDWGNTPLHNIILTTMCVTPQKEEEEDNSNNNRERIVRLLIEKGNANINQAEEAEGRTPLFYACELGDTAMVKLLLSYGANTEAMDIYGRTPLFFACAYENIMELLILTYGANIHHMDDTGNTVIVAAREEGSEDNVRYLQKLLLLVREGRKQTINK